MYLCTYIDDLDSFVDLQEFEGDGDVLQLLVAEGRLLVVLAESLAAEHLDEGDQPQAVGEIGGQVADVLVDGLEVLVRPAREAVLLNQLPLSVSGQISLFGVDFHASPTNDLRRLISGRTRV